MPVVVVELRAAHAFAPPGAAARADHAFAPPFRPAHCVASLHDAAVLGCVHTTRAPAASGGVAAFRTETPGRSVRRVARAPAALPTALRLRRPAAVSMLAARVDERPHEPLAVGVEVYRRGRSRDRASESGRAALSSVTRLEWPCRSRRARSESPGLRSVESGVRIAGSRGPIPALSLRSTIRF